MNRTKIEWVRNPDGTPGFTWNPITGCLNGCEYCYARRLANGRLRSRYLANKKLPQFKPEDIPYGEVSQMYIQKCFNDPFYPRFWMNRIEELTKATEHEWGGGRIVKHRQYPKGIFVCDMSDLFGIGIPEQWTRRVLYVIERYPQHRFYLLTKQPQNLAKFSPFPDNCWVGVSATDVVSAVDAFIRLYHIEAKVKYLSIEPMLNRMDLSPKSIEFLDWVIIGAQSKPTVLPKLEWVEEIVRACDKAGVPVFLKDNLKPLFEDGNSPCCCSHRSIYGGWELRQEMPE